MARISLTHRAGLDFLDQVLFNELVVRSGMDWLERDQLLTVISRVSEMVEARCTGSDAEVIKHLTYYFLEVGLANTMDEMHQAATVKLPNVELPDPGLTKEQKDAYYAHIKVLQSAWMLAVSEKTTGVAGQLALEIAETLKDEFAGYSPLVRRDLVRRCFVYEFQDASLAVYYWLVKTGVLPVTKTSRDRLSFAFSQTFMTRLSLLAEFESLMHAISKAVGKTNISSVFLGKPQFHLTEEIVDNLLSIENTYRESLIKKSLKDSFPVLSRLGIHQHDDEHIQTFFNKLGMRNVRLRMHTGTLASWLGVIGAALVDIQLTIEYENAARRQYPNGPEIVNKADLKVPPIFNAFDNQGAITEIVKDTLSAFGFTINPDTLYRVHSKMNNSTLGLIDLYCKMTREMGVVMSNPYEDMIYPGIFIHAGRLALNSGSRPDGE